MRLSQNLPNFLDAYGPNGKHNVDTLLENHATKIFHRNGDPTTNEWAAKIIAKETLYKHSISTSGSIHAPIGVNSQTSVSEVPRAARANVVIYIGFSLELESAKSIRSRVKKLR